MPSAALAAARLLSAIDDFSLTVTICSFWAKSSCRLLDLLEAELQLLDLILEKGLGIGVGLEPLVEVGGDEGVAERRSDALGAACGPDHHQRRRRDCGTDARCGFSNDASRHALELGLGAGRVSPDAQAARPDFDQAKVRAGWRQKALVLSLTPSDALGDGAALEKLVLGSKFRSVPWTGVVPPSTDLGDVASICRRTVAV